MRISIHQPNFFPYEGIIDKIRRSDIFVILGYAQYERGNYQNRFSFKDKWYTMSVNQSLTPICEKIYRNPFGDWQKIKSQLPEHKVLDLFDNCIGESLLETNSKIIKQICTILDIKTTIDKDYPTELKSTARLVDICKHYGADKYLSGSSGKKYLDMQLFEDAVISVEMQDPYITPKRTAIEYLCK